MDKVTVQDVVEFISEMKVKDLCEFIKELEDKFLKGEIDATKIN